MELSRLCFGLKVRAADADTERSINPVVLFLVVTVWLGFNTSLKFPQS